MYTLDKMVMFVLSHREVCKVVVVEDGKEIKMSHSISGLTYKFDLKNVDGSLIDVLCDTLDVMGVIYNRIG